MKYKSLFAFLLAFLPYAGIFAYDFEVDGIYYKKISANQVEVTSGTNWIDGSSGVSYKGSIIIPETVKNQDIMYNVVKIGNSAFINCAELNSINIPNSITTIESSAFYGCIKLTSLKIPNSVTFIGSSAFFNCYSISSISVADDNPKYDSRDNCNAIIDSKQNLLILGCKKTVIPNSVTSIGDNAFFNCSSIKSLTLPDNLTSIGSWAFCGCTGLSSIILPNTIKTIGTYAFQDCTGLTSVIIPNSITSISAGTFKGCVGLKSIILPNNVISIGYEAFSCCKGLKTMTIGKEVKSIDNYAFKECSGIISIISLCDTPPTIKSNTFESYDINLKVPYGKIHLYKEAEYWKEFKEIEEYISTEDGFSYKPLSLNEVVLLAYQNEEASVKIPLSIAIDNTTLKVVEIGEDAFRGKKSLQSIDIPNTIRIIGKNAFEGCKGLKKVNVSDLASWSQIEFVNSYSNPLTYAHNIYLNGDIVEKLIIPAGITVIKQWTYNGCTSITDVDIPNGVVEIKKYAFNGCTSLVSVLIPRSAETIDEYVFKGCSVLSKVNCVPINPPTINSNTFDNNHFKKATLYVQKGRLEAYAQKNYWKKFSNIVEKTFPDENEPILSGSCGEGLKYEYEKATHTLTISGEGFMTSYSQDYLAPWASYSEEIQTLKIEDGVTAISSYAFNGCSSLTSVILPMSVTAIGECAFANCKSLTSVYVGVVQIFIMNAFKGCDNITDVYCYTSPYWIVLADETAFSNLENATLHVHPHYIDYFKESNLWKNFKNIVALGTSPDDNTGFSDVNGSCGEGVKYSYEKATHTLTISGEGEMKNYYTYVNANSPWYYLSFDVQTIKIETGVTYIGNSAFSDFCALTSVTIPNGVDSIGECAFCGCAKSPKVYIKDIESWCKIEFEDYYSNPLYNGGRLFKDEKTEILDVVIPKSMTSIGNYTFTGCSMNTVTIHDKVTSIGNGAFAGCKISSIGIPNSVVSIGDEAFSGSNLLTIEIPNSVTNFGTNVFMGCSQLNSVRLPENLKTIEAGTFAYCTSLKSINIPNSVTSIELNAFQECTGLTSITIPDSVSYIGEIAFTNCKGLTSITIPNSVITIDQWAFSGCSELESIVLGSSVSLIRNGAFELDYGENQKLKTIVSLNPNPPTIENDWTFSSYNATLQVPNGCIEAYQNAEYWKNFKEIINIPLPDGISYELTGEGAVIIRGGEQTGSVEISATIEINGQTYNVIAIAENAFMGNQDISSVTIPDGVTSIGDNAFNGCTGLIIINIGKDVQSIGNKAFANVGTASARTRSKASEIIVNCYAESVPQTALDAFENTPIETGTLFVVDNLKDEFETTSPWNSFGKIIGFEASTEINAITKENKKATIFDMQGNKLNDVRRGVNIIRTKEGKTRKVVVN